MRISNATSVWSMSTKMMIRLYCVSFAMQLHIRLVMVAHYSREYRMDPGTVIDAWSLLETET